MCAFYLFFFSVAYIVVPHSAITHFHPCFLTYAAFQKTLKSYFSSVFLVRIVDFSSSEVESFYGNSRLLSLSGTQIQIQII